MMKFRPAHVALLAAVVGAALVPVVRRRMRHAGPSVPETSNGSKDQGRARASEGGESYRKNEPAHSAGSTRAARI